jgi:tetratricopeptide (TPR) repeat protein
LSGAARLAAAVLLAVVLAPAAGAAEAPPSPATGAAKPATRPAPARDPWREARALADRGQPDSALAVLRVAIAREPKSFGLRWLEAGVTGEAGRHAEAVRLYERLASEFPARAGELELDLARARAEAGDARGAIRDLQRRLAADPGDRDARRALAGACVEADSLEGALACYDTLLASDADDIESALDRARVLGWMGRHGDAIAAYAQVLEREPGLADAELGMAQNENWNGRHRRAAGRLEALVARGEGGAEAWKALAFARYWDDDPDRAQVALERARALSPDDREAAGLAERIARENRAAVELGHGRSNDSDGLNVTSPSLELSWPLAPRTGASLGWRHDEAEDAGGTESTVQWSGGLRTRWSPRWTTRARGVVTSWDSAGGVRMGGDLAAVSRPTDGLRLELGVARDPVATRLAMSHRVSLLGWGLGVDVNATPRLALHADGRVGSYSDGNRSERTSFSATWRAYSRRAWELSLLAGLDQLNVHRDLDHGYYDPDFYREWGPGVEITHRPDPRWEFSTLARTGWQREKAAAAETFYGLSGRVGWQPGLGWLLALEGGATDSNLNSDSGYRRSWWRLSAARGF